MSVSSADLGRTDSAPAGARIASALSSPWLALGLLALAILMQSLGHQNADNSFQFTFAEKVLEGARPYVDIRDTNPPASFLLYTPAILIARATHLRVEFVVVAFAIVMACLSVWLAATIARSARLLRAGEEGFLLVAATFALLVLPAFNFAEREHFAAMWLLPMLALHGARMSGATPALRHALGAGLLAGLAIAIKPYFALAAGLSFAGVMATRRSPAELFRAENMVAGLLLAAYAASVPLLFPSFFDALPIIVDTYLPVRVSLQHLATTTPFVINIVLFVAALLIGKRTSLSPRVYPLLAASAGFTLVYFWQGKGWMNHELPAVTLLVLALAMLIAPAIADVRSGRASAAWSESRLVVLGVALPATLFAPLMFGATLLLNGAEEHEGLIAAVRRAAPPHPKIMALSEQLLAGFPLVRELDGEWVGRAQRLWITVSARMLIAARRGDADYRARLARYVADDTSDFLADVRTRKPDVILVDTDPRIATAIRDIPALAASLEDYEPRETADDLVVWTRRRDRT